MSEQQPPQPVPNIPLPDIIATEAQHQNTLHNNEIETSVTNTILSLTEPPQKKKRTKKKRSLKAQNNMPDEAANTLYRNFLSDFNTIDNGIPSSSSSSSSTTTTSINTNVSEPREIMGTSNTGNLIRPLSNIVPSFNDDNNDDDDDDDDDFVDAEEAADDLYCDVDSEIPRNIPQRELTSLLQENSTIQVPQIGTLNSGSGPNASGYVGQFSVDRTPQYSSHLSPSYNFRGSTTAASPHYQQSNHQVSQVPGLQHQQTIQLQPLNQASQKMPLDTSQKPLFSNEQLKQVRKQLSSHVQLLVQVILQLLDDFFKGGLPKERAHPMCKMLEELYKCFRVTHDYKKVFFFCITGQGASTQDSISTLFDIPQISKADEFARYVLETPMLTKDDVDRVSIPLFLNFSSELRYGMACRVQKGVWFPSEDNLLLSGLEAYDKDWETIHERLLPVYTKEQIAIHFKNKMSRKAGNNLIKDFMLEPPFSNAEKLDILTGVKLHGERWDIIAAQYLPHRSPQSIQRYYKKLRLDAINSIFNAMKAIGNLDNLNPDYAASKNGSHDTRQQPSLRVASQSIVPSPPAAALSTQQNKHIHHHHHQQQQQPLSHQQHQTKNYAQRNEEPAAAIATAAAAAVTTSTTAGAGAGAGRTTGIVSHQRNGPIQLPPLQNLLPPSTPYAQSPLLVSQPPPPPLIINPQQQQPQLLHSLRPVQEHLQQQESQSSQLPTQSSVMKIGIDGIPEMAEDIISSDEE